MGLILSFRACSRWLVMFPKHTSPMFRTRSRVGLEGLFSAVFDDAIWHLIFFPTGVLTSVKSLCVSQAFDEFIIPLWTHPTMGLLDMGPDFPPTSVTGAA